MSKTYTNMPKPGYFPPWWLLVLTLAVYAGLIWVAWLVGI